MTDEVKIVGGTPMGEHGEPTVLDSRSKTEQVKPEIRVHEEQIVESDKVRHTPRKPGEPEVRIRHTTGSFDRALEGEED
jgi:hypothetical protein